MKQRYSDMDYWRKYHRYLPADWRLEGESVPEELWWEWRGHDVHLDRLANAHARVQLILLHGGGGNGRILMSFAPRLRAMGAEVIAPDLPGYGLTDCPDGSLPTYDRWAELVADLVSAERRRRGLPIILFGGSLGGFLSYGAAARKPDVSGIIVTTLVDTRSEENFVHIGRSAPLTRALLPLLRKLPRWLSGLRIPMPWVAPIHRITNNREFSRVFAHDRLGGGSRVALAFFSSLLNFDIRTEPERFTVPTLVIHPGADPWTPGELSRPFFNRIAAPKEWVDLPGCGHLPYEEPGVSVMWEAIERFLSSRLQMAG